MDPNGLQINLFSDPASFYEGMQNIEDPSNQAFQTQSFLPCDHEPNREIIKIPYQENCHSSSQTRKLPQDWDPSVMLNHLSFLQEKFHELQDHVRLIVDSKGQPHPEVVTQEQQLITTDLTSLILQFISAAGSLLPSVRPILTNTSPSIEQLGQLCGATLPVPASGTFLNTVILPQNNFLDHRSTQIDQPYNRHVQQNYNGEEHESKDDEDGADEEENLLPPGSYKLLQLEKEKILAPPTHCYCKICGKKFKRDANLRMHMRGHGDEYKTLAALAKPPGSEPKQFIIERYSCPCAGCKRNKDHKKFQPLKTILSLRNHYIRTHCDKSYTCSKCNTKKFSVISDLRTHEKHCSKDKWLCSCGNTFTRKDKLFGHIAILKGHRPALPSHDTKKEGSVKLCFGSNPSSSGNGNQNIDDPISYLSSSLNFEGCDFDGFDEFSQPPFADSQGFFSFLMSGQSFNHAHQSGGESISDNL